MMECDKQEFSEFDHGGICKCKTGFDHDVIAGPACSRPSTCHNYAFIQDTHHYKPTVILSTPVVWQCGFTLWLITRCCNLMQISRVTAVGYCGQ